MASQSITNPPIDNPMAYIDTDDPVKVAAFKAVNDMAYQLSLIHISEPTRPY